MTVTQATVADAAEINDLVNIAYRGERSQKGWASEAHLLDGSRIDVATVTEYLNDPKVTLLKYTNREGQIIGCVYLENRKPKLYLGMLSVMPELQANGVGRQLLHEAEKYAFTIGCNMITMTVISTRTGLLDWYIRRGYHKTGEVLPFHVEEKFGIPRESIELLVLEKEI